MKLSTINQEIKRNVRNRTETVYNVNCSEAGPHIISFSMNTARIWDGWQELTIEHSVHTQEYLLEQLRLRAVNIQSFLFDHCLINRVRHVFEEEEETEE
jgi:hypothetical protein